MIIFGAILLSFLITLGFYLYDKTQYKWWEFFIGTIATTLVVSLFYVLFNIAGQTYTEIWGSTVISIYEQEPYNKWVHRTCTRTYTDSKGNTHSESYDCSYQDDVGPSWEAMTNLGEYISISEHQYDSLLQIFGGKRIIADTRKNHSPRSKAVSSRGTKFDGSRVGEQSHIYRVDWPKTENTRKAVATQHRYTNKVKASDLTIFNIELISDKQADSLQLFKYPKLKDNLRYPTILGVKLPHIIHENFRKLNGKFGPTNEVRLWILVFEDKPSSIAKYQENYWIRGNMNELVICIGKKDTIIQWADVFSWTTNESFKLEIRNHISNIKTLNDSTWNDIYVYLDNNLYKYVRRDFAEFDYLKREFKWWEILISYIFGITVAIGVNIWCLSNDYDDVNYRDRYTYSKNKKKHKKK